MFLKIITYCEPITEKGKNENKEPKLNIHESGYECKSYRKISNDSGMEFILDDSTHIQIKGKAKRTIYISNHEGKTIDKICWMHK